MSVVIPACNGERTIGACLTSILEQTYRDFEIVIVDDASNDGTIRLVNRYVNANSHSRIRLIQLPNRVGTCTARNVACGEARGEYIAFIDQDDRWEADKLELQVRYLDRHQEPAELFADLRAVDSSGHRLDFTACEGHEHSPSWEDLLLLHPVYPSASLIRRQAFFDAGGFNPQFVLSGAYGDQEVHLRIRERWPIIYVNQIVGSYCWDIERPSRIESFLANLPIYAKTCWDSREQTPLRSPDLARSFINLCQKQYLYYANLLLANCYRDMSARQLDRIAHPRSEFFQVFGEKYREVSGMTRTSVPASEDPATRLLIAILLLRPDLQTQYPEAFDGELRRLRIWAQSAFLSDNYGGILSYFGRGWTKKRASASSAGKYESWLHRPNWDLVTKLTGATVRITREPDAVKSVVTTELPVFSQTSGNLVASIIIPSYNKTGYLVNCLASISANTSSLNGRYEVIVVDGGSTEPSLRPVYSIRSLRLVELGRNKGFVEACNAGAEVARGKYLVFLNNDTMVTPGWLDSLVDAVKGNADIGVVGAKLVFPSGRLQEAGSITWKDGTCRNYGRGDDPNKPEYNYRRDVDYCSAACLFVRRKLFERLGGFDRQYAPAYYEDTDLCFRVRKDGKRIVYQPRSVVIHFEGVTGGRDTRSGTKHYQIVNHEKFAARWADELHTQPEPGQVFKGRDRQGNGSVIIVERRVPEPSKNSGDNRLHQIILMLRSHNLQVTVYADDRLRRDPYTEDFEDNGVEIICDRTLGELLKDRPGFYDIFWLSRAALAFKYIELARKSCPDAKVIFDMCDLASLRERRWAAFSHDKSLLAISEQTRSKELYVARRADLTLTISEREKAIMLREDSSLRLAVLPNIHVVSARSAAFEERRDLLYLGGFEHAPNVDGLFYFLDEIFGRIRDRMPDINLVVIGSDMPNKIRELRRDSVKIQGYVEELGPFFNSSRVFVAPLRFGAGIKGKIGSSMAHGLPVVTTSVGAEGMGLEHGTDVLVADKPEEFADSVIHLYTDRKLWKRLSKNGKMHVGKLYSPKIVEKIFLHVLRRLPYATQENLRQTDSTAFVEELGKTRQELASLTTELAVIESSNIWAFLRFLASHIDEAFPEGTSRGTFRKTLNASLSTVRREGWNSFFRQVRVKIKRREFTLRS